MKNIVNFIGFQLVWFAAVLGAAGENFWIGPLVLLAWLVLHVFLSGTPGREIGTALIALGMGTLIDSLLIALGAYRPAGLIGNWSLSPPWMLALWVNFGTLVNGSLSWLKGRYLLGALLGFWGGPLAYYSGQGMGALFFHPPLLIHLAVLGVAWAVAVPLLFFLAENLPGRPGPPSGRIRSGRE